MRSFGGIMPNSRREFITQTALSVIGAAAALESASVAQEQQPSAPPAGMPPAFGTGPAVGPPVTATAVAEAEKLVQIEMTQADQQVAAETWRVNMASLMERRSGPRKIALEPSVAPFSHYESLPVAHATPPQQDRF